MNYRLWPAVPHWQGNDEIYPHVSKCPLGEYWSLVWRRNLTKGIAHIYITRPRRCQVLNPSVQEASAAKRDPIDNVRIINSSSSLSLTLTALGNSFIKYLLSWDLVIILTTRQFPCPFIHILLQFNLGWYTSIPLNLGPSPWGQGRGVSTNLGPPVGQP